MITKLSWITKFRVAVLIYDAPDHGSYLGVECLHKMMI